VLVCVDDGKEEIKDEGTAGGRDGVADDVLCIGTGESASEVPPTVLVRVC